MIDTVGDGCWGHLGFYEVSWYYLFWTFFNVQMKIQKCSWLIHPFRDIFVYDISGWSYQKLVLLKFLIKNFIICQMINALFKCTSLAIAKWGSLKFSLVPFKVVYALFIDSERLCPKKCWGQPCHSFAGIGICMCACYVSQRTLFEISLIGGM